MNTLVINGDSKLLSVECCRETKMRRDVKLLYHVMADTIGYIQVKMRPASLQLARTHTRFRHCARSARRDYKLASRSARRDYKLTSLGAQRLASRGIIRLCNYCTMLKRANKLID